MAWRKVFGFLFGFLVVLGWLKGYAFDLEEGLVAYWSFDSCDARDDSGNGHHGRIYGNPECVEGVKGMAFKFDGVDDWIHVPSSYDINLSFHNKRTIVIWFKAGDKESLFEKQVLYEEGGMAKGLNVYLYKNLLYAGGWNNPWREGAWAGTYLKTKFLPGKWHFVALVLNGKDFLRPRALKVYLDGKLYAEGRGSALGKHPDPIGIGCVCKGTQFHDGDFRGDLTHCCFRGTIDEIRIYNRALGEEEIHTLYEMGLYEYTKLQKPPYLEITSVQLTDENRNRLFEAGEKATVTVSMANSGKGTARNMKLRLSSEGLKKEIEIAKLEPNTSITERFTFKVPLKVKSGKRVLTVELLAGKYSPEPVKIAFMTKAAVPPHFKITYRVDDDRVGESIGNGNGIPEPRETIELFLNMANTGKGTARGVELFLESTDLDVLTGRVRVGNLPPGGKTTAKFLLFVPAGFRKKQADLRLRIDEALGLFGATTKLALNIKKSGAKIYEYVAEVPEAAGPEASSVTVEAQPAPPLEETSPKNCVKTYPNRYLFVSAVYDYDELSDLKYVKNDIPLVKTLGKCYLGVPEENIKVLENPSVGKFKKELRKFAQKVRAKDAVLYFYYSGHGVLDGEGKFYLLPSDASIEAEKILKETAVSIDGLKGLLGEAGGYKVAFIDACRVNPPWKPAVVMYKPPTEKMAFLFSTQQGKISNMDRERRHSAFTRALYEMARAGVKNIDLDASGYVEIKEIEKPLRNWLREVSASPDQRPDVWGIRDIPVFPVY
jgi:hypothetical protein